MAAKGQTIVLCGKGREQNSGTVAIEAHMATGGKMAAAGGVGWPSLAEIVREMRETQGQTWKLARLRERDIKARVKEEFLL